MSVRFYYAKKATKSPGVQESSGWQLGASPLCPPGDGTGAPGCGRALFARTRLLGAEHASAVPLGLRQPRMGWHSSHPDLQQQRGRGSPGKASPCLEVFAPGGTEAAG